MSDSKALAVIPRTFLEVQSMALELAKSSLMPDALKNKAADVAFSILCGQELGLAPIASIRGIHIISGRPTLAADTMMGVVLGSGLAEYFIQLESSPTSVTFECKRKGAPHAQKCTWTIEDANRAGVTKNNTWRLYPRQMLAARAKAELARSAFPDILAGVYDPDELAYSGPTASQPEAIDAEIVSMTPTPDDLILIAIDESATLEALESHVPQLAKLTGDIRTAARERYRARKHQLMQEGTAA